MNRQAHVVLIALVAVYCHAVVHSRRIFVSYYNGKKRDLERILAEHATNTIMHHVFDERNAMVLTALQQDIEMMLQYTSIVMGVQDDPHRYPMSQQQQQYFDGTPVPWGVERVQAPKLWAHGIKGKGVTVCVIDSGIDATHMDLKHGVSGNGNNGPWDEDSMGHGTMVAGVIVAADNGIGLMGVAPEARIYSVPVPAITHASDIVAAAMECRVAHVDIIHVGLGGSGFHALEQGVFHDLLYEDGVLTVAPAGNDGTNAFVFPASYAPVVSVAAVDTQNRIASFSQHNTRVDFAAPGVSVLTTFPMPNRVCRVCAALDQYAYGVLNGTSLASPHVAGVAALLLSTESWTPGHVLRAMQESAHPTTGSRYGLIDAHAAYQQLQQQCNQDESLFRLDLVLDDDPQETSWVLGRGDGVTELSGSGYSQKDQHIRIQRCIPSHHCYTFAIYDSYGDGMDGGSYRLVVDDTVVKEDDVGDFGAGQETSFGCLHVPTSVEAFSATSLCPIAGQVPVHLVLRTHGPDTFVTLVDKVDGTKVWHHGGFYEPNQEYVFEDCIDADDCHVLTIHGGQQQRVFYNNQQVTTNESFQTHVEIPLGPCVYSR